MRQSDGLFNQGPAALLKPHSVLSSNYLSGPGRQGPQEKQSFTDVESQAENLNVPSKGREQN